MKYIFLPLLTAALVTADVDGNGPSAARVNPPAAGTDAVSLTLVDDWILAEKALGLDIVVESCDYYVLGADNNLDIIQAY